MGQSPSRESQARIIDRGRGPELAGTRITVYRIMDFLRDRIPPAEIARELDISDDQLKVALDYIGQHQEEVEAEYERILKRVNQPNPPGVAERRARTMEELRERILGRPTEKSVHDRPVRQ
jgi:uncharacterized protein (DUF433 family)